MSTRITLVVALFLLFAATLTGVLLWKHLPDPMASHWNGHDQIDGYLPKFWGVFLMPLVALGMLGLFLLIPIIDPLKANLAQFRGAFNLFVLQMIALLVYLWTLTILWNLGFTNFRMSAALLPALGLLFMYIGLLLRKARRNWFIGIRTPWTLSSDRVWEETHRLGSTLFLAAGLLTILGTFFGGEIALWLTLAPLIGSALFLTAYSYILYRRDER